MTNAELLQINPQHLDELRSFFAGFEFDDIDIAAKETVLNSFDEDTLDFQEVQRKLRLDGIFHGKDHTHFVFYNGVDDVDDTFYCYSFAKVDNVEEHIIFKLTRSGKNGTSEN